MLILENNIENYDTEDPEYETLTYLYALIEDYYDG
jgi:hypothetical protein